MLLDLTPEDSIETEIVQADETMEQLYGTLTKLDHCLSSPLPPHMKAAAVIHPPATDHDLHATDPPTVDPHATDSPDTHPAPVDLPAVDPPPSAVGSRSIRSAKVKLPKISLPRFNGHPVK